MPRRVRGVRRTPAQVASDDAASELMRELGRALRDARRKVRLTQEALAAQAGVVQGTISALERGRTTTISLLVVVRAARAVGTTLHAYLENTSSAREPRDIAHLRAQALLVELARLGGWHAIPEAAIDDAAERSRAVDALLERARPAEAVEVAVMEVIDWFADLGASLRAWDRRLARVERQTIALRTRDGAAGTLVPRASGCWVVRATQRNRTLVSELRALFAVRFTGSGREWLEALGTQAPMPAAPALLWISVRGDRIWASRL
jgi:transcriptional regulator with XRE-family HTH domain